jgi:dUTP pyrophosphatase
MAGFFAFSSAASPGNSLRYMRLSEKARAPTRGFVAAGFTLYSAVNVWIPPREKVFISTDLKVAMPRGIYGRIMPRSNVCLDHVMGNDISEEDDRGPLGVDVVIDEDYRKPLGVTLFNHWTDAPFQIEEVDQIALLVCESIVSPPLIEDNNLDKNVFFEIKIQQIHI